MGNAGSYYTAKGRRTAIAAAPPFPFLQVPPRTRKEKIGISDNEIAAYLGPALKAARGFLLQQSRPAVCPICDSRRQRVCFFCSECEVVHISPPFRPLRSAIAILIVATRGKMARQLDSLGFRFALLLVLSAVVVLTLSTWLDTKTTRKWAAPISASDPVYRAQHLKLY